MATCINCNSNITENYCSICGQASKAKRIDSHYISHELQHLMHFEKGFFYTVKELLIRPGLSIRAFIEGNRSKHIKPIVFLILTSLIYTILAHYFDLNKVLESKEKVNLDKSSAAAIVQWVQNNIGYANLFQSVFIALFVQLFFKKYKYNYFEIIVVLCYAMGQAMLILSVVVCFVNVIDLKVFKYIILLISFGYTAYAIGQFFDKKKPFAYIKAFIAYFLGYVSFFVLAIAIGSLYDVLFGK